MVQDDEEARALAYRQQRANRKASEAARNAALTGDAAAAQSVRTAWEPLVLARREAKRWAPQEEESCHE